jgi:hypothetical protein
VASVREDGRHHPLDPGVIVHHQHAGHGQAANRVKAHTGRRPGGEWLIVLVDLPVPTPVPPLPILGRRSRGLLLLGALAPFTAARRTTGARGTAGRATKARSRGTTKAPSARRPAEASGTGRAAEASGTGGTTEAPTTGTGRTAEAPSARGAGRAAEAPWTGRTPRGPSRTGRPTGAWSSHGPRLSLLDDDGAPLQQLAGHLLDGRLGAVLGDRLDEGKAARAAGLAVQRDLHAANFDALGEESFSKLLLVDVIGKVADE